MPPVPVRVHRLAAQEFRKARSRYAGSSRTTALRFVQAENRVLEQVADDPERWPLYDDRHRWVKVRKFPYLLICRSMSKDELTVVAVAHTSRRPGYWRRR